MTTRRSRTVSEIPLWLLPQALVRTVRDWGDALYRISVKRTHWHHFNVTVRTKPIPKELAPGDVAKNALDTPVETKKGLRDGHEGCPA